MAEITEDEERTTGSVIEMEESRGTWVWIIFQKGTKNWLRMKVS